MSVKLETFDTSAVSALTDARLYEFLTNRQAGIVEGANITSTGGLGLHITSGWGVILGRVLTIQAEDIIVNPSLSGTQKGRLLLQIDISNQREPIKFVTQAVQSLPDLQQENINSDGTIYQLELATYNVSEVSISALVVKIPRLQTIYATKAELKSVESKANTAQSIANAAMPKSGGEFTGHCIAPKYTPVSGYAMRNTWVGTDAYKAVPSAYIWFEV